MQLNTWPSESYSKVGVVIRKIEVVTVKDEEGEKENMTARMICIHPWGSHTFEGCLVSQDPGRTVVGMEGVQGIREWETVRAIYELLRWFVCKSRGLSIEVIPGFAARRCDRRASKDDYEELVLVVRRTRVTARPAFWRESMNEVNASASIPTCKICELLKFEVKPQEEALRLPIVNKRESSSTSPSLDAKGFHVAKRPKESCATRPGRHNC